MTAEHGQMTRNLVILGGTFSLTILAACGSATTGTIGADNSYHVNASGQADVHGEGHRQR